MIINHKHILNLILVLILFVLPGCGDVESQCVFANQLMDSHTENLRVLPGGERCIDDCLKQCNSIASAPLSLDPQINDDIIDECVPQCRAGTDYTRSFARRKSTDPAQGLEEYPTTITLSSQCTSSGNTASNMLYESTDNSIYNYFYSASFQIDPTETVSIRLDPEKINGLALCGKQSNWLVPNPYVWTSTDISTNSSFSGQKCINTPLGVGGVVCFTYLPDGTSASYKATIPGFGPVNGIAKVNVATKVTKKSGGSTITFTFTIPPPTAVMNTDRKAWNARNSFITDSGINARDGDMMTIEWYGPYISKYNLGIRNVDDSLLLANPLASAGWSNTSNTNQMYHIPGCQVKNIVGSAKYDGFFEQSQNSTLSRPTFLGLTGTTTALEFDRDDESTLKNRDACTKNASKKTLDCTLTKNYWTNSDQQPTTDGLDHYYPYNFKINSKSTPINIFKAVRKYSFSGYLTGFSKKFTRLAFMHPEFASSSDCSSKNGPSLELNFASTPWNDNYGGHTVHIQRLGCIFNQGQKLLYALTIPDEKNNDTLPPSPAKPGGAGNEFSTGWMPVVSSAGVSTIDTTVTNSENDETLNPLRSAYNLVINYPAQFTSQKAAKIWFAIDTSIDGLNIDVNNDANNYNFTDDTPSLKASEMLKIQHRYGEYNLILEKTKIDRRFVNIISGPVNDIYSYLFTGNENKQGIVPHIFDQYVINSNFSLAIRAVLVLFVAISGLLFALGMSPLTQKEAIPRLLKFAIVAMLLTPDSWTFFYTHFFAIFTDGVIEIISYLVATIDQSAAYTSETYSTFGTSTLETASANIRNNIGNAFSTFDILLAIFLSTNTFIKLFGLVFSTWLGWALAAAFVIAFSYAFVGIFRAVIIYLISLIGIGLLIMLAPVFICFILFKSTKTIFDGWLKQLMSFSLQPIITIPAICLLSYLLLVATYSALGFTACSACMIAVPFLNVCLIKSYFTLGSLFVESGLNNPLMQITPVLCLLVIGQAIYIFSYLGPQLGQQIIASFGGVNLAQGASHANPITNVASGLSKMLNLSNQRR